MEDSATSMAIRKTVSTCDVSRHANTVFT